MLYFPLFNNAVGHGSIIHRLAALFVSIQPFANSQKTTPASLDESLRAGLYLKIAAQAQEQ